MSTEINEIYRALKQGKDIVVATIISSRGSTPRSTGAKMLIYADGQIFGTIGGGKVEGDVIDSAKKRFKDTSASLATYDLNQPDSINGLDLICGGKIEILLEHVAATDFNKALYQSASNKIHKGEAFILAANLQWQGEYLTVEREIIPSDETNGKTLNQPSLIRNEGRLQIFEPIITGLKLYIFGAGHIALEISKLAQHLGMSIHVFDDREEFANRSRFPDADGIHLSLEYRDVFESFAIGQNSYIIIVTRGHSFDKEVLRQALETDAGYIGMMGSRKKRNTIYAQLIKEGVRQDILEKIHCPIGLGIGAETPAEIALSILAEVIQHRNQHSPNG